MSRVDKRSRRAAGRTSATEPVPVPVAGSDCPQLVEERDWAQLLPDLVCKIADDLLSDDVTEYIRLRAVCKPWRNSTSVPSTLDPRFFPRQWLLIAEEKLRRDGKPERFVNVRTGATLRICLPTPKEYTYHCNAEGLLVLCHSLTDTVCLLNPLTMAFTDLPMMSTAAGVVTDIDNLGRPRSNPTVVLSLNSRMHTAIVCALPGDSLWRAVDMSCADDIECELPAIRGGLAVQGRFFVPNRAGDVLEVEVRPQPRLTYVARQAGDEAESGLNERSYLVPSGNDVGARMLLLRTWGPGNIHYEVFMVDLGNRRLTPHEMGGTDTTVFLPSVTLRSSAFPNVVVANIAYLKGHMRSLMQGLYI
ncbi:hypothetical protein C2845_PM06G29560 [Panicum miliaceum]|uniref:KIB1-4 beta-propeller domain-containing protein n=1 Tax=Panicum miliaceum TaxID=4540 RepID=A0A3L6R8J3_PANMI|nr:hypothetical protein C2845_PM06G29560 [Panicum miliaceum]